MSSRYTPSVKGCEHNWEVLSGSDGLKYRCSLCDTYGYRKTSPRWHSHVGVTKIKPYRCRMKDCVKHGTKKSWAAYREAYLCDEHK